MEELLKELVKQVERVADNVDQLNTEISSLNYGDFWDGKLVDALNEIAKSLKEK